MTVSALYSALKKPFASSLISRTPNGFDYVAVETVVNRLNAVLGPASWSYDVLDTHRDPVDPDFVVALGRLTIDWGGQVSHFSQWGGQQINRYGEKNKNAGQPMDLGNDFKGAASDALKKCASYAGVALHLALGKEPHDFKTAESESVRGVDSDSVSPSAGAGAPNPPPAPADDLQDRAHQIAEMAKPPQARQPFPDA